MPYQVSMMGWVGSGTDFCGLGWVQKFWVGLGIEKVTHDQLCTARVFVRLVVCLFEIFVFTHTHLVSCLSSMVNLIAVTTLLLTSSLHHC